MYVDGDKRQFKNLTEIKERLSFVFMKPYLEFPLCSGKYPLYLEERILSRPVKKSPRLKNHPDSRLSCR